MQEQVNVAKAQLSSTIGDLVPTVEEVRHKIEARLAKAQGVAELAEVSIDPIDRHLLEIEQAQRTASAQARIAQIARDDGTVRADRCRGRRAQGSRTMSAAPLPPPSAPAPSAMASAMEPARPYRSPARLATALRCCLIGAVLASALDAAAFVAAHQLIGRVQSCQRRSIRTR